MAREGTENLGSGLFGGIDTENQRVFRAYVHHVRLEHQKNRVAGPESALSHIGGEVIEHLEDLP